MKTTWIVLLVLTGCATAPVKPPRQLPPMPPSVRPAAKSAPVRKVFVSPTAGSIAPSFIGSAALTRANGGVLWATNRLAQFGAVWPSNATLTTLLTPPKPLPPRVKSVALTGRPYLSEFYTVGFTPDQRVLFLTVERLTAGKLYVLQWSFDLKVWWNFDAIMWQSTSPDDYWRVGSVVPVTGPYVVNWRVVAP